jgi:hypothetical protein
MRDSEIVMQMATNSNRGWAQGCIRYLRSSNAEFIIYRTIKARKILFIFNLVLHSRKIKAIKDTTVEKRLPAALIIFKVQVKFLSFD